MGEHALPSDDVDILPFSGRGGPRKIVVQNMHTHRSLRLYRCECVLTSVRLFWHRYNYNNISVFSRVVAGFTIHGVCWTLLDIGQCLIDQRTLTIVGSRVPVWDSGPVF